METILIANANIVNEGKVFQGDVLIKGNHIDTIGKDLASRSTGPVIDAKGQHLFPGAIDDQVHFREPGLTHKGNIYTESRAAVAGGVTSFMEMPNTNPPVFTQELLEQKYQIASQTSLANYSFFMGASNDNLEEVMMTDISKVCGLKIFMGSSTGNLLVDDPKTLELFFSRFPSLIAAHCEDEQNIRKNAAAFKEQYGKMCRLKVTGSSACGSLLSVSSLQLSGKATWYALSYSHISTARETSCLTILSPGKKDYGRGGIHTSVQRCRLQRLGT